MLSGLPGLRLTCKASSIFVVPQKLTDFRGQIKKIHGIEKKKKKKKEKQKTMFHGASIRLSIGAAKKRKTRDVFPIQALFYSYSTRSTETDTHRETTTNDREHL